MPEMLEPAIAVEIALAVIDSALTRAEEALERIRQDRIMYEFRRSLEEEA